MGLEMRKWTNHSATQTAPSRWRLQSEEWPVLGFTLAYLTAAVVATWATGNLEFVFDSVVMVFLLADVWALHRHVELSQATLWTLSAWGLAHMAGGLLQVPASWPIQGDIRVLYSLWIVPGYFKYADDHVQLVATFPQENSRRASRARSRSHWPSPTSGFSLCALEHQHRQRGIVHKQLVDQPIRPGRRSPISDYSGWRTITVFVEFG